MSETPIFPTVKKTLADVLPPEVIGNVRAMERDPFGRYLVDGLDDGFNRVHVCCPIGACYVAVNGPIDESDDPLAWVPWWPSVAMMTGTDEATRHIPKTPFDTPERRDVAVAVIEAYDASRHPESAFDRMADWTVVPVEVLKT